MTPPTTRRPSTTAPAVENGTSSEEVTIVAATVTPINSTVSDRRAAAIARRKAAAAERKARLEKMTDEQKAQFKSQEKAERASKRAASQAKRPVRVPRIWLAGMADTLAIVAAAVEEGKTVNFKGETLNASQALGRIATAIRAQMQTTTKAVVKAVDKIWVVVQTDSQGNRIAYDKSFRGAKGQARAEADAQKRTDYLQQAQISGYTLTAMKLSDVQALEIVFASQKAA
jgi:hypothetical protein